MIVSELAPRTVFPILFTAVIVATLLLYPQPLKARPLPNELAEKESAIRLFPASPWQLNMADDRCVLAQRFKSEEGPGLLIFEQIAPGKRFDLTVAGPDVAQSIRGAWFYAGMRSDHEMRRVAPMEYEIPEYDHALTLSHFRIDDDLEVMDAGAPPVAAAISPDAANMVERLVLRRSTTVVSFETGNMKEPIDALNMCTSDLLETWALDTAAHQAYHPPQMPDEHAFFDRLHHQLTTASGNEGHKSLLRVRAIVESDGKVSDCFHEYALSSGGLAPNVCDEIMSLQFKAATDSDGSPIRSFYSRSVKLSEYDPWQADPHGGR